MLRAAVLLPAPPRRHRPPIAPVILKRLARCFHIHASLSPQVFSSLLSPLTPSLLPQITHPIAFNFPSDDKNSKDDDKEGDKDGVAKDKEGGEATAPPPSTHPSAQGLSDADVADGKTWGVRVVLYSGAPPDVLSSEDVKAFQVRDTGGGHAAGLQLEGLEYLQLECLECLQLEALKCLPFEALKLGPGCPVLAF